MTSSALPALLVEAFTDTPCQGNGAAVVLLPAAAPDAWMQQLARSLNQSETAFLLRSEAGWLLRWFTPLCEVPLCGHATLAALLALKHWGLLEASASAVFHSRSGPLPVRCQDSLASIVLPSNQLHPAEVPPYLEGLLQSALGAAVQAFWRSSIGYSVVLLPPEAPLARLQLETAALEPADATGLVLMQALQSWSSVPLVAGQRAQYQLRFYAPGLGIAEDPVTGSAHALVAPYWLQQCQGNAVVGWQCSPRPGGMRCEAASSGMIRLSGSGTVLWQGDLQLQLEPSDSAARRWLQLCVSA